MLRVAAPEASQHQACRFIVGLVDLDDLETALERGVTLEEFLVFGPRGGRDRAQLAARKRRLEQVRGIRAAGGIARADQRVRFVDEEHDRHGRGLHFVNDVLQALLELPLHAGAGLQQAQVERQDTHLADHVRDVGLRHAQRETFDERGFAHARFADENRIVLAPAREHVDHLLDLAIAAEDGIDVAAARLVGQIDREARKRVALDGPPRRGRSSAVARGGCRPDFTSRGERLGIRSSFHALRLAFARPMTETR